MNLQWRWFCVNAKMSCYYWWKWHFITDWWSVGIIYWFSFETPYMPGAEQALRMFHQQFQFSWCMTQGEILACVVQVNCGKIQSKNILRTPAEAKVAILGPVKGTIVMFIDTINTLLLTQFSELQIQLVQKTCSFSNLQIPQDYHSVSHGCSVKQPSK